MAASSTERNVRPEPLADPLTAAPATEAVVVVASAVVSVPDVSTADAKARLQVRPTKYRGDAGFSITGKDSLGRQLSIFTRTESTARAIVQAVKADDRDEISRLLRADAAPAPTMPPLAPTAPSKPLDPADARITAAKALTVLLGQRDGIVAERRRLIGELRADGWPMAAIAEAIGISRTRAYAIVDGKG